MDRGVHSLAAVVAWIVVLALSAAPAAAGPNPGVVQGSTATFTGDQASGIVAGTDFTCPPVTNLVIRDLTSRIHPRHEVTILWWTFTAWTPGVDLTHHGADGGNGGTYASGGHGQPGLNLSIDFDAGQWLLPDGTQRGAILTGQGTEGGGNFGIGGRSFGGDGGNGGDAYVLGPAGNGGWGRPGGNVGVRASADPRSGQYDYHVNTQSVNAPGILAVSQGGDGGNGGDAWGIWGVGGSAGAGGDGGQVSVYSDLLIETLRQESHGIQAQSMGGATGVPGDAGGFAVTAGDSGSSGRGGPVSVECLGRIRTWDADSHGILAQSVGGFAHGAGGAGGFLAWGGSGASSGNGGTVQVVNGAEIFTWESGSCGIVGQSIGGGGGSATQGGGVITFGGDGNASGDGAAVHVTNQGSLSTNGGSAPAVLGQSIGGGGGRGGGTIAVIPIAGLGYGGRAGPGGSGGAVTIDGLDGGSIRTSGAFSHGLQGQSIGGGGGSGGNIYAGGAGVLVSAGFTFGGAGGSGGHGGTVLLRSEHGDIATTGDSAHGLFGQSVGGGGGSGGSVYSITSTVGVGAGYDLSVHVGGAGGKGGKGGNGGSVTLGGPSATPPGTIATSGRLACAAVAQSIGGGGGQGGNSLNASVRFDAIAATADVGGSGGDGGTGGPVAVHNRDRLTTRGAYGYGILAQSIGGGGGAGGNVVDLAVDLPGLRGLADLVAAGLNPGIDLAVAVGGQGAIGGGGGTVSVSSAGAVDTHNVFAHGIVAQSVGGGGGAGGSALNLDLSLVPSIGDILEYAGILNPLDVSVTLGGRGGMGGDGAAVTVHNEDDVTTGGPFASAILAQSIGGGGGSAALACDDLAGLVRFLDGPSLRYSRGCGSGGTVTVENGAAIATHGSFAHGILAQSVGGGGGFAAISEGRGVSTLALPAHAVGLAMPNTFGAGVGFVGSCGGAGSADAVQVTHTGRITTWGDVAHGILAQSAAGSGVAGTVTVAVGGEIAAHGADAHAVFAQSVAGGGGGRDIVIDVLGGGTLQGGSGGGAGVCLEGGAENRLSNAGEIRALGGLAVVGGAGNETIDNRGVITGDVRLGAGANALNNLPGAVFNAGARVELGDRGVLTNEGVLSPGGEGVVARTTVVGDLVQRPDGVLRFDLGGLGDGEFDCICVTGMVGGGQDLLELLPVAGRIEFALLPGVSLASLIEPLASHEFVFLEAPAGYALDVTYDFSACPRGFAYEVFEDGGSLRLKATHLVPEPAGLVLLALGALPVFLRRRRASTVPCRRRTETDEPLLPTRRRRLRTAVPHGT